MEVKANYVLIGLATIAGLVGTLVFTVWLASVQLDRQFRLYDIFFDSVAGLGQSSSVRYSGLLVGQVVSLELVPGCPLIRVRVEVGDDTPVDETTIAELSLQGVTGTSYVQLTPVEGIAGALQEIPETCDSDHTVIPSRSSPLQDLVVEGPSLVEDARELIADLQSFAGQENQEFVSTLLENVSRSSGALDTALQDFSTISRTVALATEQITDFTDRLDEIGGVAESALRAIESTLETSTSTIAEAETTLMAATGALDQARATFESAGGAIESQVPRLADEASSALRSADAAVQGIAAEVETTVGRFGEVADVASARLQELEATLAAVEATLADADIAFDAVTEASESVETLVEGTGASLVDEARATLQSVDGTLDVVNEVVARDLPAIASDIRAATASAAAVVGEAETALAELPDRFAPLAETARTTLATATETLARARTTLDGLDAALGGANRTLAAAERTFEGASDVIETEVAPAAADIRAAAAGVEATMAELTADLPELVADLAETAERARGVAETVQIAAEAAVPGVRSFTQRGLPEFTQFARQAQDVAVAIERLVSRIESDPARFFLGGSSRSEFRQ
jgi:phospholipid/cholesterol/gamma-HCH transport system substrate-binding protein